MATCQANIVLTAIGISLIILSVNHRVQAAPIMQRQTIGNELAYGLTGTGTSFNSISNYDPYYEQQQQNALNDPYDDILMPTITNQPRPYNRYNTGGWRGFGSGKGRTQQRVGGVKGAGSFGVYGGYAGNYGVIS